MIQLEFFEEETTTLLKREIQRLKESNDKTRKALFARHGELAKNYLDILHRLEIIERNICQNQQTQSLSN